MTTQINWRIKEKNYCKEDSNLWKLTNRKNARRGRGRGRKLLFKNDKVNDKQRNNTEIIIVHINGVLPNKTFKE